MSKDCLVVIPACIIMFYPVDLKIRCDYNMLIIYNFI